MTVASSFPSPNAPPFASRLHWPTLRGAGIWAAAATAVLFGSLLAAVFGPVLHGAPAWAEDDAEYYRVIAAHLAHGGVSTFDGQSLTNGYHPLWEAMLVLQTLTVGPSFLVTQLIEAVLVAAAFPVLARACQLRTALGVAIFLALYGRLVAGLALTGMEISALVGATALLVAAASPTRRDGPVRGGLLGVAAAMAVLARIDAAVFVLPLVAFAPLKRSTRVIGFGVAGAIGAAYVGYNLLMFGSALPISSAVKSLGGLQLNTRALAQLTQDWRDHHLMGRYVQTFALLALSPAFLVLAWRRPMARALAAAALVGGVLFTAKILLASSWRIWPWYNFPVLFGLLAGAAALGQVVEAWVAAWAARRRSASPSLRVAGPIFAAVILAALAAKAAVTLHRAPPPSLNRFDALDARAAQTWAPVLQGARVAMGDRAGAFAARYPGSVVQLEGLVNDREYLQALKAGGDLTPLLCGRGVRFVLAYRPDLGDYQVHRMPVMRQALTRYAGPVVTLRRVDEVGKLQDRSLLDLRGVDEGDDTLYLWRLGGCGASTAR